MKKMFNIIHERLNAGEALVLVTVTASSGATPRGPGARMLVAKEGRVYGTIGCRFLQTKVPKSRTFR